MLSDLNTIVQFFSALYVTIAIDNMMFNRKHPTPILAVWTISATFAPC